MDVHVGMQRLRNVLVAEHERHRRQRQRSADEARRTASGEDDDDVFLSLGDDEEGAQLPPQSVAFVENGIGDRRSESEKKCGGPGNAASI